MTKVNVISHSTVEITEEEEKRIALRYLQKRFNADGIEFSSEYQGRYVYRHLKGHTGYSDIDYLREATKYDEAQALVIELLK